MASLRFSQATLPDCKAMDVGYWCCRLFAEVGLILDCSRDLGKLLWRCFIGVPIRQFVICGVFFMEIWKSHIESVIR